MRPLLFVALMSVVFASGCGDRRVARVSGRVLVDGKPVAKLRVSFSPIGTAQNHSPGPPSIAFTDEDGRFTLKTVENETGALVGPCRVRISSPDEAAPEINAKLPPRKVPTIPSRFNEETILTFDVPPEGTDQANFEVSWK